MATADGEHPALSDLWTTMGHAQANLDRLRKEAEADLPQVEAEREQAWQAFEAVQDGDDQAAIDAAQAKLDQLDVIYRELLKQLHDPTQEQGDEPDALRTVKSGD